MTRKVTSIAGLKKAINEAWGEGEDDWSNVKKNINRVVSELETSVEDQIKFWHENWDEYRESAVQKYGNLLDSALDILHKVLVGK